MDRSKNQSKRSRNQMELCWSCGEKNRQPLDKPHSFWMPRRNRGRPRTTWKDGSDSFVEHWHCVARGPVEVNGEGLRRPTTDIQLTFNGWNWTEDWVNYCQRNIRFITEHIKHQLIEAGKCWYALRRLRKEGYNQGKNDHLLQTLVVPKFFSDGLSVYAASISELNTVQ